MSWRFPVYRLRTNHVPDSDDINENFQAFTEELAGELNEHNWANNAFNNSRDELAEDIAFRVHTAVQAVDPNAAHPIGNEYVLHTSGVWEPITDMSITVTTTGGTLWVVGSYEVEVGLPGTGLYSLAGVARQGTFHAVRVGGAVDTPSIIGTAEIDNDNTGDIQSVAVVGERSPVVVEGLVTVPPGTHVVELVIKASQPSRATDIFVTNREMFILEMRR